MSVIHSVFVLARGGAPLTPTTPARARKLLEAGVAKKVWSKFNTFGIQMLVETRQNTPETTLGYDPGTKFEGYAVICDRENVFAAKVNLLNKQQIVQKMKERSLYRRNRRQRKCRCRPARYLNRKREGAIPPSQSAIVGSRLKMISIITEIYPINAVGMEDVRFNHPQKRWGKNFSAIEIGKNRIRQFLAARNITIHEFAGYETQAIRQVYGYKKTRDKGADCFTAHCTDALSLACRVGPGISVTPTSMTVVDDTYRPIRRQLHDACASTGGVRQRYSCGNIRGLRKGLLIGARNGNVGVLCGTDGPLFTYYFTGRSRRRTTQLAWISSHFKTWFVTA